MTIVSQAIDALTPEQALRALADVADHEAPLPDPARLRAVDANLRQALTTAGTDLEDYREAGATADSGDLAKATLQYLAETRPDLQPVITRAIALADDTTRFDPVTLAVGALVVTALQTEVKLARNADGRWTFTVHKHHMRDSTLGQIITKLLAAYGPGGN